MRNLLGELHTGNMLSHIRFCQKTNMEIQKKQEVFTIHLH